MNTEKSAGSVGFRPELTQHSFKVSNLEVSYHGKKVVKENSSINTDASKSGAHKVMARILTPVARLFESYSKLLIDEKNAIFSGKELKNRIVDFTKNLNEVNKAIKQKEKENDKLKKDTKRVHFHQGRIEANEKSIQELKNEWKTVKRNIDGLKEGLKGTFFEGSTVLVKLNRAEKKLDDAFERNNSPLKAPSVETEEVVEAKPSREERAGVINGHMNAICSILLKGHYLGQNQKTGERISTELKELSSRNADDKSILSMISAREEVARQVILYQANYINLLDNVEMNYAFDDNVPDSVLFIDRIRTFVDDISSPKLRDDGLARAYRDVIKKDLEVVRDKLKILIGASQDAEEMHRSVEQILAVLNAPQQRPPLPPR